MCFAQNFFFCLSKGWFIVSRAMEILTRDTVYSNRWGLFLLRVKISIARPSRNHRATIVWPTISLRAFLWKGCIKPTNCPNLRGNFCLLLSSFFMIFCFVSSKVQKERQRRAKETPGCQESQPRKRSQWICHLRSKVKSQKHQPMGRNLCWMDTTETKARIKRPLWMVQEEDESANEMKSLSFIVYKQNIAATWSKK